MATKKTTKKTLKAGPQLPFTKANTLALADEIHTDLGGKVSYLKLCDAKLANGKDGGRTLHCAVGEAYFAFVNTDMRRVLKTDEYYVCETLNGIREEGPTAKVIEELVEKAQLKNPTIANKNKLARALNDAVSANDNVGGEYAGEYEERAQDVANVFRKKVAPLLK